MKVFDYDDLITSLMEEVYGTFELLNDRGSLNKKPTRFSKSFVDDTGDAYVITTLAAGVKKEDIEILYKEENGKRSLTISINKGSDLVEASSRTYFFDKPVNKDMLNSILADGVLTVTVPKDKSKDTEIKVEIA